MKCVIFGSREFTDYKALEQAVKDSGFEITLILNGKAKGGDALGEQYGKFNKIPVKDYPADWDNLDVSNCNIKINDYGKKYNSLAGFNRNQTMCDECDVAIGLQAHNSSGTNDMEKRLKKAGKPCFMVKLGVNENERIEF